MAGDGTTTGRLARLGGALAGLLSFRVAVALSTSVSVTAAVAGPLAIQAMRVRDRQTAAAPTTTTAPPRPTSPPSTAGPSTTVASTTTASTTTAPATEPVVAAGTVVRTTTTVRPGTTTTLAPSVGTGLAAGVRDDRQDAVDLDGARLAGEVYLFVTTADVVRVRWWLDHDGPSGPPTRTATVAPFDLGSPFFDTTALSVGRHRVYAELDTQTGTLRRSATFDVAR